MTAWASRPPRVLIAVAGAVAAVGVLMSVVGAVTTGISIDDDRHVTRLNVYWEQGLYDTEKEIAEADGSIPPQAYVYGPVTALIQHAANRALGFDAPRRAERSAQSYTVRHLVIAAIGVIGLLAVAALAWLLLGDWRWGIVAAGALAAIPLWTGYAMFNSKDIPVATGHTLATLGLVMLATTDRASRLRSWPVLAGLSLAAGAALMVGTRPGMWASLAASVTILTLTLLWTRGLRARILGTVAAALMTSYLVLWLAYPRIFGDPWRMLRESVGASANYGDFPDANGRSFLPIHTLTDWPLILLGLAGLGTAAAVLKAIQLLRGRSAGAAGLLLVGSQAFTLPVLILIKGSPLYQGLRQVLFTAPAYAVLVAVGIAVLSGLSRRRVSRVVVATVVVAGLALPLAVQSGMFPFQYAYVNVAAEAAGVPADNDPLGTSYRSVIPHVPATVKIVCPRSNGALLRQGRNAADCRTKPRRSTLSPYWRASGRSGTDRPESGEYYAILRGKDTIRVPDFCRTAYTTTRWRNLGPTVSNRVVMCDDEPPPAEGRSSRASRSTPRE
jgi:hypothetical protein